MRYFMLILVAVSVARADAKKFALMWDAASVPTTLQPYGWIDFEEGVTDGGDFVSVANKGTLGGQFYQPNELNRPMRTNVAGRIGAAFDRANTNGMYFVDAALSQQPLITSNMWQGREYFEVYITAQIDDHTVFSTMIGNGQTAEDYTLGLIMPIERDGNSVIELLARDDTTKSIDIWRFSYSYDNAPSVYSFYRSPGTSGSNVLAKINFDNATGTKAATASITGKYTTQTTWLGRYSTAAAAAASVFPGVIFEVLIFTNALPASDRDRLINYMQRRL